MFVCIFVSYVYLRVYVSIQVALHEESLSEEAATKEEDNSYFNSYKDKPNKVVPVNESQVM